MIKLDVSKKALGKCILAKGGWHSLPEFETLGGKKTKKWRHSLMHQGRPLHEYDLTFPKPPTPPQPQLPSGASVHAASLPPCFTVGSLSPTSNVLPSPQPHSVNPVLFFMKAFRLRSDKDSLKRVVVDRFSCTAVDSAKKDLWSFCSDKLNLPFQARSHLLWSFPRIQETCNASYSLSLT